MSRTIEVKRKKPGRKPIYDYEKYGIAGEEKSKYSVIITVRLPIYAINRLDRWIKEGTYQNRSRAIHDLIMKSDEETLKELGKLKRKVEVLEAENEALRRKIKLVEEEKNKEIEELKRKYHELLKEHEEVVQELMQLRTSTTPTVQEKEEVEADLWVLVDEYLKAKEESLKARTQREVDEAERRKNQLANEIYSILDSLGIDKVEFWKALNLKGLDEAKKLVGG